MSFTLKALATETLSEYLRGLRQDHSLSLESVSEQTGVPRACLELLETGRFQELPADVYVRGFLHALGKFYATATDELYQQYRKERAVLERIAGTTNKTSRHTKFAFLVTPRTLSFMAATVVVVGLFGYVVYQLWMVNPSPKLEVLTPSVGSHLVGSAVDVAGRTDPGFSVTINQVPVFVNSKGEFQATVGLQPGVQQIEITSTNKFGNKTSKRVEVLVEGQVAGAKTTASLLKLTAMTQVTVTVAEAGSVAQRRDLLAGESWEIEVGDTVAVGSSNGLGVKVEWQGQDGGTLGPLPEPVSGVKFSLPERENVPAN